MCKAVGQEIAIDRILKYTLLILVVLVIQGSATLAQDCSRLADGRYYFRFKAKNHKESDFMLTVMGETYFITRQGKEYPRGRIEWWPDNCMFKLSSDNEGTKDEALTKEDSLSSSGKGDSEIKVQETDGIAILRKTFMSWGDYCYEITNGRKFRLTYCGNLHITSGAGRIIKK